MANEIRPGGRMVDLTAADSDITKHNGQYPRSVFVGTGGTVKIMDADGNISTWLVGDGGIIPCTIRQVRTTDTTASGFVGIW